MRRLALGLCVALLSFALACASEAPPCDLEPPIDETSAVSSAPRAEPPSTEPAPPAIELGAIESDASLPDLHASLRALKRVHLKKRQITTAIKRLASRLLDRPMGSETIRVLEGKRYSFCVEPHYHAPGSGLTPEGWHTGVTVYGFEE